MRLIALATEADVPRNALIRRHIDPKAELYQRIWEVGADNGDEARLRTDNARLSKTIAAKKELRRLRAAPAADGSVIPFPGRAPARPSGLTPPARRFVLTHKHGEPHQYLATRLSFAENTVAAAERASAPARRQAYGAEGDKHAEPGQVARVLQHLQCSAMASGKQLQRRRRWPLRCQLRRLRSG